MQKLSEETCMTANTVLTSIPQRIKQVQAILATDFPPTTPSQLTAAFSPGVSPEAGMNQRMVRLISLVLDEIHVAIQELQRLERWIQLLIPQVADGNNFGVEVQKVVLHQISASRTALQKSWDSMTDYHWQRATAYEKFALKHATQNKTTDTSTTEITEDEKSKSKKSTVNSYEDTKNFVYVIPDLIAYVVAVDVKWYFNLQRTMESIVDHYAFSLDSVEKNGNKIRVPINFRSGYHQ